MYLWIIKMLTKLVVMMIGLVIFGSLMVIGIYVNSWLARTSGGVVIMFLKDMLRTFYENPQTSFNAELIERDIAKLELDFNRLF